METEELLLTNISLMDLSLFLAEKPPLRSEAQIEYLFLLVLVDQLSSNLFYLFGS